MLTEFGTYSLAYPRASWLVAAMAYYDDGDMDWLQTTPTTRRQAQTQIVNSDMNWIQCDVNDP